MEKSLAMLKKLKLADLEKALNNKTYPKVVASFVDQLKQDFKPVIPPVTDPVKQAENLLNTLYTTACKDFSAFGKESFDKLLLVYDIVQHEDGLGGYLVGELHQGMHTIQVNGLAKIKKQLITQHMNNILSGLQEENEEKEKYQKIVIQACTELGMFFQANFPGKSLQKIQEELNDFDLFKQKELPSLKLIGVLKQAQIQVKEQLSKQEKNKKNLNAMEALSLGIDLFETFMGKERVSEKLDTIALSPEAIVSIQPNIHYCLPSNAAKRANAANIINSMQKDCYECKAHLTSIFTKEAQKLPNKGSQYFQIREQGINLKVIDVDRLCKELLNRTGNFAEDTYYHCASRELIIAAQSYQVIKKFYKILNSDEPNPIKKLENARDEYNNKETKAVLESNPDSKIEKFFKKLGYYLANLVTVGLVHAITQGSPLMSPQQQLSQRTNKSFKLAAKEQMINMNKGPK